MALPALIYRSIHSQSRPYGGEDGDQRLDDRPPNGLLVTHHSLVFKVQHAVS